MRKIITFIMLVLLLVGCTSNEDTAPKEEPKDTAEQEQTDNNPEEQEPINNEEDTPSETETPVEEEEPLEPEPVTPLYEVSSDWSIKPIEEGTNEKVVLLTIDDAPETYGVEMAETLKKLEAPAIFFVNGHFIDTEEEQEKLKQIADMGFEIGNHTYSHTKLDTISEEQQRDEIIKLSDQIEDITGKRPKFFRAPHGVNTDFAKELVAEEGMTLMNWTYGYDYFAPYMDAEKLKTAMITGEGPLVDVPYSLLKPGANLLMHDREWTAAALADIVKGLRDQGYEMVDPNLIKTP
ncbi:peptidoglycan/xylan/chitin deacetylase (PgdA/CDA1 family) [Salirhabdus euzebyi]|uniref:Peptidoglycan/xylan/chitin deacetylase (PgdA/CDA1 family) n=1 Tax=Salirhabdus euzebyi TaxID=394506 RepID=A0A841Q9Q3_9BACI|nr:polysaccharide deacetylase family protein [Salirhabdus euzebyi]MBB6454967.1 peptidoglycan/xylan/chitin deacetylase (PgdA/CDA1 family) [Salirhabdus euzebyi]